MPLDHDGACALVDPLERDYRGRRWRSSGLKTSGSRCDRVTRIPSEPAPRHASSDIDVLKPDMVGSLRLRWDARFSLGELREILTSRRSISLWNKRTGDYVIGGPWRNRDEIATIVELGATGGAIELIHAFVRLCEERGITMVIASEQAERRRREFYESAGLDLVEEIVIYELPRVRPRLPVTGRLRFQRLDLDSRQMFDDLVALDHAAFPWLWWNSRAEFLDYVASPGVEVQVAYDESGQMLAYIGTTRFRTWGHLDRIAVASDLQGRGIGRIALDHAVTSLANGGARQIALSTQASNLRSRRLYEAYGFRRSPAHDYRLYGRELTGSLTIADDRSRDE